MASKNLKLPHFQLLICCFLYDQTYPNAQVSSSQVSIDACPASRGKIAVFYDASATFCAPSDPSGLHGMHREFIQATPSWHKGHAQYNCIFINMHPESTGMWGLQVAHVFLFFSMVHRDTLYSCALVQQFSTIGDEPDDETGLWMIKPDIHQDGKPDLAIVHLNSVLWAAHLIPAYCTSDFVRRSLTMHDTLDEFKLFYVNKFVDHHAFKIAA